MIDISKGRFWDKPWSLVDGCTPCSPGCDHCWSAAMAHRYRRGLCLGDGRVDMSITHYTDEKGQFDGRIKTHPERLSIPLKRRQPTVYAVWNDLFHEAVPDEFQRQSFEVMRCSATGEYCHDHTFIILTKRPQIMADFIMRLKADKGPHFIRWPLPWVWLGLTVCNQQEMEDKSKVFFSVPGRKFLSLEPLLSKIIIPPWVIEKSLLDAVIIGGETGPGARPMHPDWVRSVRDQCAAAGVPFFFKGWGKYLPEFKDCIGDAKPGPLEALTMDIRSLLDGKEWNNLPWL